MWRKIRKAWTIFGVVFAAAFAIFFAYGWLVNAPHAKSIETDLKREFDSIGRLPGAERRDHYVSHKTQQALVGSSYSTTKPYSEIRKHYDEELARRGWKFHREQEVADWGRDLGGRTTEYCKGDYRASLQYAGQSANYGWVFALDLSWGLDSLVDRWRGRTCRCRLDRNA